MENIIEIGVNPGTNPEFLNKNLEAISKIDNQLSYTSFFEKYMSKNIPCIIKNVSDEWNCTLEWVKDNSPNFDYFRQNHNNQISVPVYDCKEKYFNSQKKLTNTFCDFINYWELYRKNNYPVNEPVYYLKDWHFIKKFPNSKIYDVPQYFASDWLNEYLTDTKKDDYMFVYMGPKGTWTPFHADVFTSYSWSTNICGQKKWLLFPPGEENKLRDRLGNLPYDCTDCEINIIKYEVYQEAGEAIFVPSGWHHQVWNTKDTISVNHNWVNGCNIKNMWTSLLNCLNDVKKEIADCNDMENWLEQCQILLNATFGIDCKEFYNFLLWIAKKRIDLLQNKKNIIHSNKWFLGKNHCKFDLMQIRNVLVDFVKLEEIDKLECFKNIDIHPKELILIIDQIINYVNKRAEK